MAAGEQLEQEAGGSGTANKANQRPLHPSFVLVPCCLGAAGHHHTDHAMAGSRKR
jgi:hypothetical protein